MPESSGNPSARDNASTEWKIGSVRVVNSHLLRRAHDGLEILDTGSPVTLPVPDDVRQLVHRDVVRIVGMDELGKQPFLLDWARAAMTMGAPSPTGATCTAIEMRMGVPLTTIEVHANGGAKRVRAVLDTGAQISYAPAREVEGRPAVGSLTDFYPLLGTFTTELYEVDITFLGVQQRIRVGVLPPLLATALSMIAVDSWILGADFFRSRVLWFDTAGGKIGQATGSGEAH